jgi:hypothetical protein
MENYAEVFTKDFGNYISRTSFNWFNEETKDHTLNQERTKLFKIVCPILHKNKTKIIPSFKKDYSPLIIERLISEGVKAFHLNGATFKYQEYKKIINDLKEVFLKYNEFPTVLFDLKGSVPYITRLEGDQRQVKVKAGETVKITFDNPKIKETGIIYIDKKIAHLLKEGDMVYISSSDVRLKVIRKEKYCHHSVPKRTKSFKEVLKFTTDSFKEELRCIYDQEDSMEDISLTKIKEEDSDFSIDQDEQMLFEANHFDSYFDEKIINRQMTMNQTYRNIIKKHDFVKSNENFDKSSQFSFTSSSIIPIILDLLELESSYKIRRNLVKNSSEQILCIRNNIIYCEVVTEGVIGLDHYLIIGGDNSVNRCESSILGPKDIIDISKLIELNVNTLSCMIDNVDHIKEIRDLFPDSIRDRIKIFAKIETERAIVNFDSILAESDGIIIKLNSFFTKIPKEEVKVYIKF